jgi:hypothetical protein
MLPQLRNAENVEAKTYVGRRGKKSVSYLLGEKLHLKYHFNGKVFRGA